MKRILFFTILAAVSAMPLDTAAQTNYQRQYELLSETKNKDVLYGLLDDWEKADSTATDMLVGQFNRYAGQMLAKQMGVSVEKPAVENYMELKDSTEMVSGYLYEYYATDTVMLKKALGYADRAILSAPDRVDIRFGKIYTYWLAGDDYVEQFIEQTATLMDELGDKKREWMFNNEPYPREKIAASMQDYCANLFSLQTEQAYKGIERISKAELKIFPKHAIPYSNLGSAASRRGDHNAAETFYKKALKITPKDVIVLKNLAITATKRGKTKDADKYLSRIRKFGTDDDRKWADAVKKQWSAKKAE